MYLCKSEQYMGQCFSKNDLLKVRLVQVDDFQILAL